MKWNLTSCKSDARNYKTRSEWAKLSSSAYQSARRNGWLEQCCLHMGNKSEPRIESIINEQASVKVVDRRDPVKTLKEILKIP